MLTSIIPLPYRILLLIGLGAGAGFFGWIQGCRHVQSEWDLQKAKTEVLVEKSVAQATAISAKRVQDTQTIENDYRTQINTLREAVNAKTAVASTVTCTSVRVRQSTSAGSGSLPTPSTSAGGTHESTPYPVASGDRSKEVGSLPTDCAETTQQLISLQSWVTEVCTK